MTTEKTKSERASTAEVFLINKFVFDNHKDFAGKSNSEVAEMAAKELGFKINSSKILRAKNVTGAFWEMPETTGGAGPGVHMYNKMRAQLQELEDRFTEFLENNSFGEEDSEDILGMLHSDGADMYLSKKHTDTLKVLMDFRLESLEKKLDAVATKKVESIRLLFENRDDDGLQVNVKELKCLKSFAIQVVEEFLEELGLASTDDDGFGWAGYLIQELPSNVLELNERMSHIEKELGIESTTKLGTLEEKV